MIREIKDKDSFFRVVEPVQFDSFLQAIRLSPISLILEEALLISVVALAVCVVLNLFFCAVQLKKTPQGQLIVVKRDRSKFDELDREEKDDDELGDGAERFDEEQLDIGILQRVREFEMTN